MGTEYKERWDPRTRARVLRTQTAGRMPPACGAWSGRSPGPGLRGGRAGGVGDGGISSSGVGVPWPVPRARLKVRHPGGKAWAWRPGRSVGASCRCKPLAQAPQGRGQAENLLVAASLKDVQAPRPAKGRRPPNLKTSKGTANPGRTLRCVQA